MALSFKGRHFQKSITLASFRWYLSYKLSLREIEEMISERSVEVDHTTVYRWVLH